MVATSTLHSLGEGAPSNVCFHKFNLEPHLCILVAYPQNSFTLYAGEKIVVFDYVGIAIAVFVNTSLRCKYKIGESTI